MRVNTANSSEIYGYKVTEENMIGDIIKNWMNNGGKCIAWLCGHMHNDMMYYSYKYPDILIIAIDQAGNLRGNDTTCRNNDNHTCLNYYSIDTDSGLLKIIRFGMTTDKFLTNKNVLCYDYINRVVISEF